MAMRTTTSSGGTRASLLVHESSIIEYVQDEAGVHQEGGPGTCSASSNDAIIDVGVLESSARVAAVRSETE